MPGMTHYLSVSEVARHARCSRALVNRWCAAGDVPGVERVGRTWLIPRTSLDRLPAVRPIGRPRKTRVF